MRAFIAIVLTDPVRRSLNGLQRALARPLATANLERCLRWVAPSSIHLTLRFLGDTSAEQQESLEQSLAALVAGAAPFALHLGGLGSFPRGRRPAVLWTGVQGDLEALVALQRSIEEAARAAGFAPEERAFSPHLTLARVRPETRADDRARIAAILQAEAQTDRLRGWIADVAVHEIVLMESVLRPQGSLYRMHARFALGSATSGQQKTAEA